MIARPKFLMILVGRELLRLRKNPSALLLLGLLTAISMLLALSRPAPKPTMKCWVVYAHESPWIESLRHRAAQNDRIKIVSLAEVKSVGDWRVYPPHDCAIEILSEPEKSRAPAHSTLHTVLSLFADDRPVPRSLTDETNSATNDLASLPVVAVKFLYPGNDPNVLQPFLQWFWPVTAEHFGETPPFVPMTLPITGLSRTAVMERLKQTSLTDLMNEELVATVLLIIVLFVTCCHLLVSFTSQDRERGTLTALALTPASTGELLLARYVFHLSLGWTACVAIIAILRPSALSHLSLWVTIALAAIGMVGVGTVIAALARTQNAAGVLALCYMLFGGVLFYLATKFSAFESVKSASFESHSFPLLFLSLKQNVPLDRAPGLAKLAGLVAGWTVLATVLFRQRGWR